MRLEVFQIDVFTGDGFAGNPACVVQLERWLSDEILLDIARKNRVPETAFLVDDEGVLSLRWFTPDIEMDLCGHATLATAYMLKMTHGQMGELYRFKTASGDLTVSCDSNILSLNVPARPPRPALLPPLLSQALSLSPLQTFKARDYLLVYPSEREIRDLEINRELFDQINLDPGGVIVTARGARYDFVSRFFTPQATILEDPVTGSAHCTLIPFWAQRLGERHLRAAQLSSRGGALTCVDEGARVSVSGAVTLHSISPLDL